MKFLAVSQDKSLVNLLCLEFQHQGYSTFGASSLKELAKIQKQEKCDIIVADHILADGNFFDYYDKLKLANKIDVPAAILLTNPQGKLKPEVAFAMGAFAVFNKPFNIRDLYHSVEDATYSKREGLANRLDERVPLICRLEYKKNKEESWSSAFSNDISFGGFFAATEVNIPEIGTEIFFKLMFAGEQILQGNAKTVWSRKIPLCGKQMGFGVQFKAGREKYVRFLVPIINEARTRQIETSVFQNENIVLLLVQSLQIAKTKIAKSKTQFNLEFKSEGLEVMCRFPKLLHAFSELIYHISSPLREVEDSKCLIELSKKLTKIQVKITSQPGGTSLDTENVIQDIINPIFEVHKAKLVCDFSSVSSTYTISIPSPKK